MVRIMNAWMDYQKLNVNYCEHKINVTFHTLMSIKIGETRL